jgi:hypothetical protein
VRKVGPDLAAVLIKQEGEVRHDTIVSVRRGHCGNSGIRSGLWRVCGLEAKGVLEVTCKDQTLNQFTMEHLMCKWSPASSIRCNKRLRFAQDT